MEAPQHYNAKEAEQKLRDWWTKEKTYAFDAASKKPIFAIDTPPPTMSGRMHIGHAFSYSQQDFIARYKRMQGHNIFFPFGTDDNGLATERMIEKLKNVKAVDMPRQDFIVLCTKTLAELRPEFIGDWQNLAISCDFSLLYSTIDKHCRTLSQWSFLDLYKKGRAYQKEAPTIWCTECRTAIAQAEMTDKEKQTQLVHIEVKTEDGKSLTFATTRPELYPSCAGMSVHPDDKRYHSFIGKTVIMPLTGAKIEVTADPIVEPTFGSGVVYFCSSGDAQFLDWETRHPVKNKIYLMNRDGTLNEKAGAYKGLYVNQARKKIIEDLEKLGAVKKIEPLTHTVNAHERCGTVIEYVSSRQWFIKYLDLKDEFLTQGEKLQWHPQFMKSRFDNWVRGLKWDWCISRQRFFGIPFPVWYCKKCAKVTLAEESQLPIDPLVDKPAKPCSCGSKEFEPEKDVLDTWATSSITPLISTKLVEGKKFSGKLLPMSMRPQGHDIISTWLFYTVAKHYLHFKELPWQNAAISGWVLDPQGQKMSKSKGNVIAPHQIMEKYSADALRFAAAAAKLGEDAAFQEKELVAGSKLITKLWNATKFMAIHLEHYTGNVPSTLEPLDAWLLTKLNSIITECTEHFEDYDYNKTKLNIENFFWHTFCDNYLEFAKDRLYNAEQRGKDSQQRAQYTLYQGLLATLKLLAPIMPHISEELYQLYFKAKEKTPSIHLSTWPKPITATIDPNAEKAGDLFVDIVNQVRRYKAQKQLSLRKEIAVLTLHCEQKEHEHLLTPLLDDLKAITASKTITFGKTVSLRCNDFPVEIGIELA